MALPLLRSHLYAPGNNAKLLTKVFEAGADAAILDLEDAVPPAAKAEARLAVAEAVRSRAGQPGPVVFVRVNAVSTGLAEADIATVVVPGLQGLRIPKVERPDEVHQVCHWIGDAEVAAGLEPGTVRLICNIESALGVWNAREILMADARVEAVALGIADFIRDIGATAECQQEASLHARGHLVLASRVAGALPPVDSVHTKLDDLEGLESGARWARGLGFFGKSAIHPRQVDVINRVFQPDAAEVAWAGRVVEAYEAAEREGSGAVRLADGEFVDPAVVRRAQDILALQGSLNAG